MNIISAITTKLSSIIGTTKNTLKTDTPKLNADLINNKIIICQKCEKKTRKIIKNHCFQCFYHKSKMEH